MILENEYDLGEIVYARTDPEQKEYIVDELSVLPGGTIIYECRHATEPGRFYSIELTREKDACKALV